MLGIALHLTAFLCAVAAAANSGLVLLLAGPGDVEDFAGVVPSLTLLGLACATLSLARLA